MGERGPSKRMTMADFLSPPQTQPQQHTPPVTNSIAPDRTRTTTTSSTSTTSTLPSAPYTIRATKKGGVPCVVEKRKHHKVVVLTNIEGDVSVLLSALQKSLGTGGVRKGNSIEVQGEHHLEKIEKFCLNSNCVVGANKAEAVAAAGKNGKIIDTSKKTTQEPATTTSSSKATTTTTTTTTTIIDGTSQSLSQKEIKVMKPTQLKEHLAARQLSTQGNKKELLARLTAAVVSVQNSNN